MKRIFVAEATGTALLLCAVVGSGIMGERLSGGSGAIAGVVATHLMFGLEVLQRSARNWWANSARRFCSDGSTRRVDELPSP